MILEPPLAPTPKSFFVRWADVDQPMGCHYNVTGSSIQDGLLFLKTHDREWIINIRETAAIEVLDEA